MFALRFGMRRGTGCCWCDRLGIKPLYWTRAGDALLFGSEIKAILASGLVEPQANEAVLPEVLGTRYTSGEETLFRGIRKLLPGHLLVFEGGTIRTRHAGMFLREAHGSPAAGSAGLHASLSPVQRFSELLEESVKLRLMADVPLGMFLSGGIDSSAIAALMAKMIDRPLQTFSVAFKDRGAWFAEARRSGRRLQRAGIRARGRAGDRTISHEIVIDDRDFFGALPSSCGTRTNRSRTHPASRSISCRCWRATSRSPHRRGQRRAARRLRQYPRVAWNWRAGTISADGPVSASQLDCERHVADVAVEARALCEAIVPRDGPHAESMFFDNFASIRLADQQQLLSPALRSAATRAAAYGASLAYFNAPNGSSTLLDRPLCADIKTYLVELLMKQDQMSMSASIESRVPFLNQQARRIRSDASRSVEAQWLDHQARAA
jgi:asparagine synthase (glutamine-hydrolysing)